MIVFLADTQLVLKRMVNSLECKYEQELKLHRCCFTGHRPQKLNRLETAIKADLEEEIKASIRNGFVTFITGMAYGVDIWAGEIVIRLRQSDPRIKLIASIPYPGFEDRWSIDWKQRFKHILEEADLVRYICPSYRSSAFQKRNEWMVDHASKVIAVFNGNPSGTKNTIDYAKKQGVPVNILSA